MFSLCIRAKTHPLPSVILQKLFIGQMKTVQRGPPAPTNGTRTQPHRHACGWTLLRPPASPVPSRGWRQLLRWPGSVYLSSSEPGRRGQRKERGPPCAELPSAGSASCAEKQTCCRVQWSGEAQKRDIYRFLGTLVRNEHIYLVY